MSAYRTACPACRVVLKSNKPLPADRSFQCPKCGSTFSAPPAGAETAHQVNGGFEAQPGLGSHAPVAGPAYAPVAAPPGPGADRGLLVALLSVLIVVVLLVGAGIVAVIYLGRSSPPPQEQAAKTPEQPKEGVNHKERDEKDKDKDKAADKDKGTAPDKVVEPKEKDKEKLYQEYLDEGKKQLALKQYALAAHFFQKALDLKSGDEAAKLGLDEANKALAAQSDEEKNRDYQKHMNAAKALMASQNYPEAIREYAAALLVKPDDQDARRGKETAERRLGDAIKKGQLAGEFRRLMDQGQGALLRRNYQQAIEAFNQAKNLGVDDRTAQDALTQARRDYEAAKRNFDRYLSQGTTAMNQGRFDEADRYFRQAQDELPDDRGAASTVQAAQAENDRLRTAAVTFVQHMNAAAAAMRAQKYADAVLLYTNALAIFPTNLDAQQGLKDARKQLDAEKKKRDEYDRHMQAGNNALSTRKYADAVKSFTEALKLYPDDDKATAKLKMANYQFHLEEGRAAMNAKRYKDAIREFEEALKEVPNDFQARALLQQAVAADKNKKP